jgi:hypothetical protein
VESGMGLTRMDFTVTTEPLAGKTVTCRTICE